MLILPERVKRNIIAVLTKAPGVADDHSDIDLVLMGSDIPLSVNTKLRDAAGLYQMDILRINELENKELLSNIEQDGVVIYGAEEAAVIQ